MSEGRDEPIRKRRVRYRGTHPRRFEEKYKEQQPEKYPDTVRKVLEAGKTPAGTHRPILLEEVLSVLRPAPGDTAVDCTLGYGAHTAAILPRLIPGGRLIGIDVDPIQLPRAERRLRELGFDEAVLTVVRTNFASLPATLAQCGVVGADVLLADLGVSSMQIDDPSRGFSMKRDGPLDMRMNPKRGLSAREYIRRSDPSALAAALEQNADEPLAVPLSARLAGRDFETTQSLISAIAEGHLSNEDLSQTIRRVFQAVRIAVNDEFSVLDSLLRALPHCLAPGGRAAILTFHSGEDRRVKHSFREGLWEGVYSSVANEVTMASAAERRSNPRSTSAKLRWAIRAK